MRIAITTTYHAEGNGLVERLNASLAVIIRKAVAKDGSNWDLLVQFATWAYNTTVHETTGETPFRLVYGRDAHLAVDNIFANISAINGQYAEMLRDSLGFIKQEVCQRVIKSQNKYKKRYNLQHRRLVFKTGDLVLRVVNCLEPGGSSKLALKRTGPYLVSRVVSDQNYEIVRDDGKLEVVHISQLEKFVPRIEEEYVSLDSLAPVDNKALMVNQKIGAQDIHEAILRRSKDEENNSTSTQLNNTQHLPLSSSAVHAQNSLSSTGLIPNKEASSENEPSSSNYQQAQSNSTDLEETELNQATQEAMDAVEEDVNSAESSLQQNLSSLSPSRPVQEKGEKKGQSDFSTPDSQRTVILPHKGGKVVRFQSTPYFIDDSYSRQNLDLQPWANDQLNLFSPVEQASSNNKEKDGTTTKTKKRMSLLEALWPGNKTPQESQEENETEVVSGEENETEVVSGEEVTTRLGRKLKAPERFQARTPRK